MTLFEATIQALNASSFFYLASAVFFIWTISKTGTKKWGKLGLVACACVNIGFILHTGGLLGRWVLGGIDRPPWTNLYESLIFFAWGVVLFQVIAQRKWKMPIVGLVSMPLVFVLMGMAVMTPNKSLEPLIPALQSYWLKIHVVFGMLSYAAFTVAACFSFLHLMRNGVSLKKITGGLFLLTLLNLGIAGGKDFYKTASFNLTKTKIQTLADGKTKMVKDVYKEYEGGPVITRMEELPGTTYLYYLVLLLFAFGAFYFFYSSARRSKKLTDPSAEEAFESGGDYDSKSRLILYSSLTSYVLFLSSIAYYVYKSPTLTLQSNPYLLMLLISTSFFIFSFIVIERNYLAFLKYLPEARRIDELSYKNILFGVPFQTLLLITGAIWAYYAWGRSWGWDPKETWALITWIVYLVYLHGRLLANWSHNRLSCVALCGFAILVFAFLGVNLVLSGLHSYGAA